MKRFGKWHWDCGAVWLLTRGIYEDDERAFADVLLSMGWLWEEGRLVALDADVVKEMEDFGGREWKEG